MTRRLLVILIENCGLKKERFLVVGNSAGTLTSLRKELLTDLVRSGLEVHAAAPGLSDDSVHTAILHEMGVEPHTVSLQRAGLNPISDLAFTVQLYHLMRRLRPNSVLSYTIKPVIYGTVAGWLARVPHRFALIAGLGHMFVGSRVGFLQKLIHRMYAFALTRAEKIFLQNPDDLKLLLERGVLAEDAATVVVNGSGVDLQRFEVAAVPAGSPRFLMICRLLGEKGVREYAEAARRIRAIHPEITFSLAGGLDANPSSVTQRELDDWVAEEAIEYLGVLADVRAVLAACTVFVLPSYYREGTPRAILEAMSIGRAVITTDMPGCRETVDNGRNGFLIVARSVDALVNAVQRFITDADLSRRMGAESRAIAEKKYDVQKVNRVMLEEMGIARKERQ